MSINSTVLDILKQAIELLDKRVYGYIVTILKIV